MVQQQRDNLGMAAVARRLERALTHGLRYAGRGRERDGVPSAGLRRGYDIRRRQRIDEAEEPALPARAPRGDLRERGVERAVQRGGLGVLP